METENASIGRKRRIAGMVLIILGGVMLIGSSGAKFAHVPAVVAQFGGMGLTGNRLMFVAVLEIVSAALFLIPMTRSAGLLLVSSYMGGAIATHLQHGESIIPPSIVLLLMWLGTWLRHPAILRSLNSARQEAGSAVPAIPGVHGS